MDLSLQELQFLTILDILRESTSIPKLSLKTFYLITLTLIFPLSFASLFTRPLLDQFKVPSILCYPIFLFAFSLLPTAAVVFTVASLYTFKPVSFSSTLSAIPKVFKRLFINFLWALLLMCVYYGLEGVFLYYIENGFSVVLTTVVISLVVVHEYGTALWHLASVVSVLEPVFGLAAMKRSYELLKGKTRMAGIMFIGYRLICLAIDSVFASVVVHGGDNYGVFSRIVVGGFLVGALVIVNLVWLLVQSVFYYVCKSHLGGYLDEYVPLNSSNQMENLEI